MTVAATEGGQGQEPTNQGGAPGQGQEPAGGQGQGTQAGQGQQGTEGQQGQGSGEFDLSSIQDPALRTYLERQQAETREARQEAARYRTERNNLQQAEQERARAAETEQERATREATERQERLDTLERENRTLRVGTALQAAAGAANAHNPAMVAQMLDARVEVGDDGAPTNVQDLLADLRRTDPYLFKRVDQGAGDGGGSGGQPPAESMNDRIRNQITARRSGGQTS